MLGDTKTFGALLESAGIPKAKIQTPQGSARFPSIESWVHTDVKGWTLADLIDDAQYRTLLKEAEREPEALCEIRRHRLLRRTGTYRDGGEGVNGPNEAVLPEDRIFKLQSLIA